VKFLAAPRRCPSRQPAGAHRDIDRRAIRRGRAGRPRHVGGCTAARLLSRQLPGHQDAGLRPHRPVPQSRWSWRAADRPERRELRR
jgi:hypothetical protein